MDPDKFYNHFLQTWNEHVAQPVAQESSESEYEEPPQPKLKRTKKFKREPAPRGGSPLYQTQEMLTSDSDDYEYVKIPKTKPKRTRVRQPAPVQPQVYQPQPPQQLYQPPQQSYAQPNPYAFNQNNHTFDIFK